MTQHAKETLFEPPPAPGDDGHYEGVAGLFAGTYEVRARLAWNGLALVYRVGLSAAADEHEERAPGRERVVALLPIDCESKPHLVRLFQAQAARLTGYTEAHTLATLAAGARHGVTYLLLPYVEGTTLAEELATHGAMPAGRALAIADGLLRALTTAHGRGLRHWDLTPSNVLLTKTATGEEQVRVLAMGLAPMVRAMTDTDMTGPTGKGSGPSPARYLAPELLRGGAGAADGRADLYSVGRLLVAMLEGARPAKASEGVPELPVRGLAEVVRKATAKELSARFESADELRAALEAVARGDVDAVALLTTGVLGAGGEAREALAVPEAAVLGQVALVQSARVPPVVAEAAPVAAEAAPVIAQPAPVVAQPAPKRPARGLGVWVVLGVAAALAVGGAAYWAATRDRGAESVGATGAAGGAASGPPPPSSPPVALVAPPPPSSPPIAPVAPPPPSSPPVAPVAPPPPSSPPIAPVAPLSPSSEPLAPPLPPPLDAFLPRIERGEHLSAADLGPLYVYTERHGGDVRGHLALARAFKNLLWTEDLLARYQIALRVDGEGARRDPQILRDLLEIVVRDPARADAASTLVVGSWGPAALSAVDAQLARSARRDVVGRLRRLRERAAAAR